MASPPSRHSGLYRNPQGCARAALIVAAKQRSPPGLLCNGQLASVMEEMHGMSTVNGYAVLYHSLASAFKRVSPCERPLAARTHR